MLRASLSRAHNVVPSLNASVALRSAAAPRLFSVKVVGHKDGAVPARPSPPVAPQPTAKPSPPTQSQPAAAPFGRQRGAASLPPSTLVSFTRDGFANSNVSSAAAATMLPPSGKVVFTSPQATLISGTALALPVAVISFAAFAAYIISVGGAGAFDNVIIPSSFLPTSLIDAASPAAAPPTDLSAFVDALGASSSQASASADLPASVQSSSAAVAAAPAVEAASPADAPGSGSGSMIIDAANAIHSVMRPLNELIHPPAEDTSALADMMRSAHEPMGPAKVLLAVTGSGQAVPATPLPGVGLASASSAGLPLVAKGVLALSAVVWTAIAFAVPVLVQRRLVGRIVRLPGRRMRVETVGIAGFSPRSFTVDAACLIPPLAITRAPSRLLQPFPVLFDADRIGKGRVERFWALRTVEMGGRGHSVEDQSSARAGVAVRHSEAAHEAASARGEVQRESGIVGLLGKLLSKLKGRKHTNATSSASRSSSSSSGRLSLGETRAGASLEDEMWVWNGVGVPCVYAKDSAAVSPDAGRPAAAQKQASGNR